jgi:hypothetical protein
MDGNSFDAMTRLLGSARSRRRALQVLTGAMMTAVLVVPGSPVSAQPVQSLCLPGAASCRTGSQCCSGVCKKKRHKRRGRCTSLGPFAANCPPVNSCLSDDADWFCEAGGGGGVCIAGVNGEPFCVSMTACTVPPGPPICASDVDCGAAHIFGPEFAHKGKCLPCANPACAGDVMCALYAGDKPR